MAATSAFLASSSSPDRGVVDGAAVRVGLVDVGVVHVDVADPGVVFLQIGLPVVVVDADGAVRSVEVIVDCRGPLVPQKNLPEQLHVDAVNPQGLVQDVFVPVGVVVQEGVDVIIHLRGHGGWEGEAVLPEQPVAEQGIADVVDHGGEEEVLSIAVPDGLAVEGLVVLEVRVGLGEAGLVGGQIELEFVFRDAAAAPGHDVRSAPAGGEEQKRRQEQEAEPDKHSFFHRYCRLLQVFAPSRRL